MVALRPVGAALTVTPVVFVAVTLAVCCWPAGTFRVAGVALIVGAVTVTGGFVGGAVEPQAARRRAGVRMNGRDLIRLMRNSGV